MNGQEPLSTFEEEQVKLISKFTPWGPGDVETMFMDCHRNFDLTVSALAFWSASNDRQFALNVADKMDKLPGNGIATLLPDHEANQKKETR